MKKPVRILIVEDDPNDVDFAKREICKTLHDCQFEVVETHEHFVRALETFQPDVILSDYTLPHFNALDALELTLRDTPGTPFIIWTGSASEDVAVECVRAGANNYILKDNLKRLTPAILHALEEKELLVARKQAEQRYGSIFENSVEGIFQSSPEGRYLNVNPAMARIYGYDSPDEMIDSIHDIAVQIYVEPHQRAEFIGLLHSQNSVEKFEARNYRKDGSIIWTATSARAVRDRNGKDLYYEGFSQDITQQKRAEEALQNSEQRFRALLQNGLDDISLLALDGTLLWESPSTVRNLGYAPDEFVGRNMFEIMHPDDLAWTRNAFTQLIQTPGSRESGFFRLRRADGTWRWVEAIATNMLHEPYVNAIVINYHDVTEQKKAEIELQQRNIDLALINALNEVINRGEDLDGVVSVLREGLKYAFSSEYTNIYLINQDQQSLKLHQSSIPPEIARKIEKLIGRAIPAIEIPVQQDGLFQRVLHSGQGMVTSDPQILEKWIGEFVETASLPNMARAAIRRLLPQIYKILNIKSTILVPLIAEGKILGMMNVSAPHIFTEQDLRRIENICGQLTVALYRKQVEDLLKEERNILRTLIDNLPDRIYTMDTQGRKTLSNTADWKASGAKTMQDVIGKTDFDLYPRELAEEFWKLDRAVLDTGQSVFNYEEPGLDSEGNIVSILTSKIPLRDDAGNVTGLVGVGRDITGRKQTEERLRRNESRYRLATKATNDVIWEWDPRTDHLDWSENAQHVFGYPAEEIGNQVIWWEEHIHPEDRERVLTTLDDFATGRESIWLQEYRFLLKDGSYAHISDRSYIERDENGAALRMIGAMSDITARKQAETERQALLEIMQGLASTKDLPELLRLIHHAIARVVYAENFFIILHQENGLFEEIYSVDQYDPPAPPSRLENSITSYVFRSGKPLLLTQAAFEELAVQGEVQLVGTDSASWLGVPLKTSGRTIGVMAVQDYEKDNRYSDRDKEFLASIATQVALVIERKRVEQALNLFRTQIDHIKDAIEVVEPATRRYIDVNDAACRMRGYTREEYLGLTVDDVDPVVKTLPWESSEDFIRSGSIVFESVNRRKDGSHFPVEVNLTRIHLDREYSIAVVRDITERKQAEELLRASEKRFSSAFEHAAIGMALVTPGGHWSRVNLALCQLLGYSEAELLQKTFQDITHPDDLQNDLAYVRQMLAGEIDTYQMEKRYYHKLGHVVWVLLSVSLVRDDQGKPQYFISQIQDITERKKAEMELVESNIRFRTLFEASPDAIVLIDPRDNWPIIDCNTAACRMNGYNREELIGQPIDLLNLAPSAAEKRGEYLERIRQAGVLHLESLHRRKDGTVFTVDKSTSIIRIGSREVILGIDRDVTERKLAEEEIRRSAKETSALLETSLALGHLDLESTLQTIGSSANSLFLADGCRVFLMEPDGETLLCVLALGENTSVFSGLRIKVGEGVTGIVADRGQAEIVNEMHNDPRAVQVPGTEEEQEAIMFAPLRDRDRTIGILSIRRLGGKRPFESGDLELLEAFASMAASAVSKARLFEETQRRLSELRASEERFLQLADNIQEGFWITDADTGQELYLSPAVGTILGRPVQSLMDEPNAFVNCIVPEDQPAMLAAIEKERRGESAEVEYRVVWPDGSIRWIWDRAFPVLEASGRVKRIAGISADITERKQAEQELRKLSHAVEQSGSSIVITNRSGVIEYVNSKFTDVTGYSFEEVIGQNPGILKSGLTADEDYERLWQTISSGREWHGELLNRKKNGELFWESVTISPILDDRKEITHYVGVKEDITTRKQTEIETRRHIAELEAVYENGLAVGRLLGPGEIGNRVIETFGRYLPWHHVTIRLRKEGSDDLELAAFNLPSLKEDERAEAERHFVARISKVGQGLSGWVIQTGVPFRTGNVHAHPQYIDTHAGIQSGLYMPLKVGDRVIGVISVESETPNAFTEQDERLLATLANQTAIAFENARLYEAMQKELLERKRAQDALRISETHYRALADSITDILFELDQDLRYTHWNKASEVLIGIQADEAIGKTMEEILGANEEQLRIRAIYQDVLQSHQPRTFETALLIHGESRSFEVNAYPSMRGVSVVAKDVTDRKRTETIMQKRFELMEYSARHSLQELMQKTVDEVSSLTGSTIGFFHFMDEDQLNLGMQTWSTSALQLFDVPAQEGGHRPLGEAGVWAEAIRQRRPLIQNDYESLAARKGVPQGHVPIRREIVIPIIRNERIMAVMGIGNKPQDYASHDLEIAVRLADYAWDITERKQMELALETERNQLVQRVEERTADLSRANSNLARALRVKDEFLANMSHELRTPLNAILGLSESLGEQIAGPLNEKQQKYISTISESGHHLLSLINDILDLAKIDAGQITMDINKVEIHSVCQASLRMIKQLAQKKNQEVALEIDKGLGLVWADERRLKQMMVNLLGNAVKFTPENGRLGLEVHGDEEANQVSITVWDNGIGIQPQDLERLFQPFVQLDSGLAREATGTGLGLALVAQMARLHGGSVKAASEPGKGSRFTIVLPWEPALAMDTASRMRITGKFRAIRFDETNKPNILLVEDTKEVVMMLKDYLELAGYNVFTAQDGLDAIVQAQHVRPDLILMDVQMPGMNGFETTRKLRSDPDFRYTPIIALTALAMSHDRERCLEAGMDDYISKPVNLKALIKIIQNCLFERESRAA